MTTIDKKSKVGVDQAAKAAEADAAAPAQRAKKAKGPAKVEKGVQPQLRPLGADEIRAIAGDDAKLAKKPKVRFAPSPTGHLHIGGARTALMNYLFAQRMGGDFVLRIEDTDQVRSKAEYTAAILEGLKWLGLKWVGEPVFQSQRSAIYKAKVDQLVKENKAYKDASGAVFFRMPQEGALLVRDRVKGDVQIPISADDGVRDFVIQRSDGGASFLMANVVDDGEMGITHVIRGDDHLTNAARQVCLFRALGYEVPQFYHVPLIHGDDGQKLSKRHGATSVIDYQRQGYDAEVVVNHLARLGMRIDTDQTLPIDELAKHLDVWGFAKAPARIDMERLHKRNKDSISEAPHDKIIAEITDRDPELAKRLGKEGLFALADGVKKRAETYGEIVAIGRFMTDAPVYADGDKVLHQKPAIKAAVKKLAQRLGGLEPFTLENVAAELKRFNHAEGITFAAYQRSVRWGLTGVVDGLPLHHTIALLGKQETVARLNAAF